MAEYPHPMNVKANTRCAEQVGVNGSKITTCTDYALPGSKYCTIHQASEPSPWDPKGPPPPDPFETESILDEAARITSTDRREKYGHPLDNFAQIAHMLTGYFMHKLKPGEVIEAADIPWVNILTKAARDSHFRMRDNYTDTAGYARTGQVVQEEIERRLAADALPTGQVWGGTNELRAKLGLRPLTRKERGLE